MSRPTASPVCRVLSVGLFPLFSLLFVACGGSDPAAPTGPSARVDVDSARASADTFGPEGGSLTATSAEGIAYVLEIPAGALVSEIEVRMAPVRRIDALPYAGGLVAAVQLEPSGLVLLEPALLRIATTATVDAGRRLVGFAYEGDATAYEIAAGGQVPGEIRVLVDHFSGAGAAVAGPNDLDDCATLDDSASLGLRVTMCVPAGDRQGFLDFMQRYLDDVLTPALENATGDALKTALDAYLTWRALVEGGLSEVYGAGDAETVLASEILATEILIDTRVREAIADAKARCTATSDVQWLIEVFEFRAYAIAMNEGGLPQGLDAEVLEGLCASAEIETTTLAEPLALGVDTSLDVDFALAINGVRRDAVFRVAVSAVGPSLVQNPNGRTDATGFYTTVVRREQEEGEVFLVEGQLLLPLFGPGGLGLAAVPISAETQIFRGGQANIETTFPSLVAPNGPTPLQVRLTRLVAVGQYEPLQGATVSFSATGGTVDPTSAISDANGEVSTTGTASGLTRTFEITITVRKEGVVLGTKRVSALVTEEEGVVVLLARTSEAVAESGVPDFSCTGGGIEQLFDSATGPITISASSTRECDFGDGIESSSIAFVVQNSDPGVAADGLSADLRWQASSSTLARSTSEFAGSGAFTFTRMITEFEVQGAEMPYQLDAGFESNGTDWTMIVSLVERQGGFSFNWTKTSGDGNPADILVAGNLPTGSYILNIQMRVQLMLSGAGSLDVTSNGEVAITLGTSR